MRYTYKMPSYIAVGFLADQLLFFPQQDSKPHRWYIAAII
jgi:hypothetical protein